MRYPRVFVPAALATLVPIHSRSPLFHAGHAVITAIREATPE